MVKANAYFDTPIPEPVRASLLKQSDTHRQLVALLQTRPATHVLTEYQKLISLNGYGRLRLILALIFPSSAYMRWRHKFQPLWILPLYYLFRWAGILKDGMHTLFVLIQGRG